jgi:hypothetical protein
MVVKIVVARYHENVEWTKQLSNVVICNKGADNLGESFTNVIQMDQNVGREGHTYYKYIVDNYDNLDDHIIFLQGNPFDHTPSLIDSLQRCIQEAKDFEFISEKVMKTSLADEHDRYPQCRNIRTTYERVFGAPCDDDTKELVFGAGAQFIVSKKNILQRPKSFYENLVSILGNAVNPDEGYDVERFHKLIFFVPSLSPPPPP